MKFAAIVSLVLAAVSVSAVSIPTEQHSRFLVERASLEAELAAWKASPAGQAAKANGLYTETENSILGADDDHLTRFFLSKLTIEKASKENLNATFGVESPFTLMTNEEFAAYVGRSARNGQSLRGMTEGATAVHDATVEALKALPASVDHTKTSSCVGPVKDQGNCGSCWAFSAIATMETALCTATGKLQLLSEQEIVSCANTSSQGCDGGWPKDGISYARANGGVCSANSYPYTSGKSADSEYSSCSDLANECTTVPFRATTTRVGASESAYMTALVGRPLSVAVAAGNPSWKQYVRGVVSSCSTSELDHAVFAVGYDANSFKIKNSWGTSWGEAGYIRLARINPSKAACGLMNSESVYATVK